MNASLVGMPVGKAAASIVSTRTMKKRGFETVRRVRRLGRLSLWLVQRYSLN